MKLVSFVIIYTPFLLTEYAVRWYVIVAPLLYLTSTDMSSSMVMSSANTFMSRW